VDDEHIGFAAIEEALGIAVDGHPGVATQEEEDCRHDAEQVRIMEDCCTPEHRCSDQYDRSGRQRCDLRCH
jgi:hypothetical protein